MKKWCIGILAACLAVSSGIAWAQTYGHGLQNKKGEPANTAVSFVSADVALEPTHLMMLPTTQVLQRNQYVLSFHEFSFGLDNNIQIFLCPWTPRAGRLWLGGKFGLREDLAVGVGISEQYWYHSPHNDYYYFYGPMFGAYGVKTLATGTDQTIYGLADVQVGDGFNFELGAGLERVAARQVKLMGELALSSNWYDASGHGMDMGVGFDLNLGLRYMMASLPQLKIDLGLNVKNYSVQVWPYVDISYSSRIR
jgi:hypothetical protein